MLERELLSAHPGRRRLDWFFPTAWASGKPRFLSPELTRTTGYPAKVDPSGVTLRQSDTAIRVGRIKNDASASARGTANGAGPKARVNAMCGGIVRLGVNVSATGISLVLLAASAAGQSLAGEGFRDVAGVGTYPRHLQGICVDAEAIFLSFTTTLVKTDQEGRLLASVPVANHHGDLCFRDENLFVAVNLGAVNDPCGAADSWVYVYDAGTLHEQGRHAVREVMYGAGGLACAARDSSSSV